MVCRFNREGGEQRDRAAIKVVEFPEAGLVVSISIREEGSGDDREGCRFGKADLAEAEKKAKPETTGPNPAGGVEIEKNEKSEKTRPNLAGGVEIEKKEKPEKTGPNLAGCVEIEKGGKFGKAGSNPAGGPGGSGKPVDFCIKSRRWRDARGRYCRPPSPASFGR